MSYLKKLFTALFAVTLLFSQSLPGNVAAESEQNNNTQSAVAEKSDVPTDRTVENASKKSEGTTATKTEPKNNNQVSEQDSEALSVSLKVIGKNENTIIDETNIEMIKGSTAFDVLKKITNKHGIPLDATYNDQFDSYFINNIGNTDLGKNEFWTFYINGNPSKVGVSYKLKDNDKVTFKISTFTPPEDGDQDNSDADNSDSVTKEAITKAIDQSSNYLNGKVSAWGAVALKKAGKQVPKGYLQGVKQKVKEAKGDFRRITDYEKYTIGILAAGGDPTNIAGYNLVEKIYNGDITKQGINGVIYGLIALDSANFEIPEDAKWTKKKMIQELVKKQNEDGGWTGFTSGSSIDITAMALTALAQHQDQKGVRQAVESAVNFLANQSTNLDNSTSTAQVIIALTANGINPTKKKFKPNNSTNLVSYLLSFQNEDGGFAWKKGDQSNVFSTEQPLQALVAYQLFMNGNGTLYEFSWKPSDQADAKIDEKENEAASAANKEGHELPDTATNIYNLLLLGGLLLLIGFAMYIYSRRKKV